MLRGGEFPVFIWLGALFIFLGLVGIVFGYIEESVYRSMEERYNGLGRGINVFISKLKNKLLSD